MSLGITSNNTQQSGLSLGVSGMQNGYQQQHMMGAQNNFMNGMMGGMGVNQQYYNAPVAPPSDTEILASMLGTIQPMDRFIISQNMPIFVEMLSNISAFSILNILKNCSFKLDDDGVMKMDLQSLPSDLQTLSAENIIAQLSNMQNASQQAVTMAQQERDRIIAISQQSLLQGALGAALEDHTFLENAGSAAGGMLRSAFGMR
ncbi:MAG: hypothetical protein CMF55_00180 [Legionellales bacterium]|nr:hypothetical protein [Legionellales bacterium]